MRHHANRNNPKNFIFFSVDLVKGGKDVLQ